MRWLAYLLIGLLSGILSGLFGIGGGILLIPALVYWFGYTQHEAQGTTLAVLIPPIGLFAALEYYRRGHMRLGAVPWLIIGLMVGAYLGAVLAPRIPETWMRRMFGLLLCYVGVEFLLTGLSESRFWPAAAVTGLLGILMGVWSKWGMSHSRAAEPSAPEDPTSPSG
ncbi:MAG: sulfite exporter TauE/SafE family protein [Gemmatales bacterium]|nr:sulfite exporter TauE/SafE family protein [Gemmatales bacterium]MCS7159367.1 sulfite exporter TauE/SafE family protein [Gemmatales bacterium]MDW8174567.1 sulfite exporter TauE/SafE family protein [Gemmatales bacterium]MDW8222788.1 sulfite exporter TauE/SafE family protein [Gemmatales bacterium]